MVTLNQTPRNLNKVSALKWEPGSLSSNKAAELPRLLEGHMAQYYQNDENLTFTEAAPTDAGLSSLPETTYSVTTVSETRHDGKEPHTFLTQDARWGHPAGAEGAELLL